MERAEEYKEEQSHEKKRKDQVPAGNKMKDLYLLRNKRTPKELDILL